MTSDRLETPDLLRTGARSRFRIGILLAVVTCAGLVGRSLDWNTFDFFHTLLLPPPGPGGALERPVEPLDSSRVVLVDLGLEGARDQTVIPRGSLARVIDRLIARGAHVIGLDLIFEDDPDPEATGRLVHSIEASGRVVLASRYSTTGRREFPPIFADAALGLGIAHLVVHPVDGGIRRVQHLHEEPGIRTARSFSLELARWAISFPSDDPATVEVDDDRIRLVPPEGPPVSIPVDSEGMSLIPYRGPAGAIPVLGWEDILESRTDTRDLTGRVVLAGNTHLDIKDAFPTPFHRGRLSRISGVEIHAQIVAGLLKNRSRSRAPPWASPVLILMAVLAGALAAHRLRPLARSLAGALLLVALWITAFEVFRTAGVFADPLPPTVGLVLILLLWRPDDSHRRARASRIDAALEDLESGRADAAFASLRSLEAEDVSMLEPRLAWGMAMTLLELGQPVPTLPYVMTLRPGTLPPSDLDTLARRLEETDALEETRHVLEILRDEDPNLEDLDERLAALEETRSRVTARIRSSLGARYSRISFLGSGGMARVFLAHDSVLEREVAIKVPDEALLGDHDARQRFKREIDSLAQLDHPAIIRLLEVGDEDLLYYTMEYLSGSSLQDRLDREGPLDVATCLTLLAPIAEALGVCHARGIVHRDIKPGNILIDEAGRARLSDFGLAFSSDVTRVTQLSATVGTPLYMAPEQLEGGDPSPRMDVYALGLVFHEALGGQPAFGGRPTQVRLVEEPPRLDALGASVPGPLADVIARALRREPEDRHADGAAFHRGLMGVTPH